MVSRKSALVFISIYGIANANVPPRFLDSKRSPPTTYTFIPGQQSLDNVKCPNAIFRNKERKGCKIKDVYETECLNFFRNCLYTIQHDFFQLSNGKQIDEKGIAQAMEPYFKGYPTDGNPAHRTSYLHEIYLGMLEYISKLIPSKTEVEKWKNNENVYKGLHSFFLNIFAKYHFIQCMIQFNTNR